jgi:alanine dehydrogenase
LFVGLIAAAVASERLIMIVGVPKEIQVHESRSSMFHLKESQSLFMQDTRVFIEDKAGVGSSITNEEFIAAGATIVPSADDVWQKGQI